MESKQLCGSAVEAREMVREAYTNKIADQTWLHDNVPERLVAFILNEVARLAQQELTSAVFSWAPNGIFHQVIQKEDPHVHAWHDWGRIPGTRDMMLLCECKAESRRPNAFPDAGSGPEGARGVHTFEANHE